MAGPDAKEIIIAGKGAVGKPGPRILAYGCTSAAGPTTEHFWKGLRQGTDHSREIPGGAPPFRACLWDRPVDAPRRWLLVTELTKAWEQARARLRPRVLSRIEAGGSLGVILASTKGEIDDWVWKEDARGRRHDPLTPVLEEFLVRGGLSPSLGVCVSNACASSLSALPLARAWLESGACSEVLLLAADAVGPFALQGFRSLRALTEDRCRPFDRHRSGLLLGEAAAAIVLSGAREPDGAMASEAAIVLTGAGLDAEGFAATRPEASGASLLRACQAASGPRERPLDLVIAHGTATAVNDACEDSVFHRLFPPGSAAPAISATKGSIGHCLGASGAMDLIAGCEAIRRGESFAITGTRELDREFHGRYLLEGAREARSPCEVLVTSLGFGGVHAAARISRQEAPA